jgi:hypothetical protein
MQVSTPSISLRQITVEVEHIVDCAARGQITVVGLGRLVFFSTPAQDAWLLDWQELLAVPLMRAGTRLPARILEADRTYSVAWTHGCVVEGEALVVMDLASRVAQMVVGEWVEAIAATIERLAAASRSGLP